MLRITALKTIPEYVQGWVRDISIDPFFLRILGETNVFKEFPRLVDYVKRCEARPAFQKAMDGHLEAYR